MADIDQTANADANIEWGRGDTIARVFTIKLSGAAQDVSGSTFKLTVDTLKDPGDALTNQFTIASTFVTDGTNGQIQFAPAPGDTDIAKAKYFYDIEETTGGGAIATRIKGVCNIVQDLTKA